MKKLIINIIFILTSFLYSSEWEYPLQVIKGLGMGSVYPAQIKPNFKNHDVVLECYFPIEVAFGKGIKPEQKIILSWKNNKIFKFTEFEKEKRENSSFMIYFLEFIASSIWPALPTAYFLIACAYNPDPFDVSPEFPLIYIGLNSIGVPSMTHFIGTIGGKRGNIENSIVGSLIGSLPGAFIIHFGSKNPTELTQRSYLFLLMLTLPSLSGVIGYNLRF